MNRNSQWHGKGALNVCWSVSKIKMLSQELNGRVFSFQTFRMDPHSSWRPPDYGHVKINADAAWNARTRRAGVGCVGRNEAGHVLFAWADFKDSVSSVVEAEMWALKLAMSVAERLELRKVQFESDCANVVDMVLLGGPIRSDKVRGDVLDCHTFLGRNHQWRIDLILREGNSVADKLAKKAKEEAWSWTELQSIPICLANFVQE
ncbi:unnamed protein product [Rhodiola kirilowii]